MSSALKYLIASIVGATICFLLVKSCDNSSATIAKLEDSIRIRAFKADSIQKEGNKITASKDSIVKKAIADSAWHKHIDDSLMAENKKYKSLYGIARDSTMKLWGELKTFYDNGDTAALRVAYYGLRAELDSMNNLVTDIQFRDQAIEYNLRNEVDSAQATIRTLSAKLDAFKSLLDQQTQLVENANKEEAKILAAQKKKKIWGIIKDVGIGIGALFLGSKL